MQAYCLIRDQPWYRREAFLAGLRAAGYTIGQGFPRDPGPDTLLLTWNRYHDTHELACRVERAGGTVLVAENGYLGAGGTVPKWDVHPRGPKSDDYYALAIGGHNGSGQWPDGGPERWERLGIQLKPWRTGGEHILVCPSRPFGRPDMTMPANWADVTAAQLRSLTGRPVRVRPHPGNDAPARPLQDDLEGAWAVVIWASSAGIHALVSGIPVFQCAPHWICTGAASLNLNMIEDPAMDSDRRLSALQRMAWAQFTVAEIETGEPFRHLLRRAEQEKVAVGA